MPWTAAKAEMTLSPDREKAIAAKFTELLLTLQSELRFLREVPDPSST